MKIQITIPDDTIKDVTKYCKIHGIDLHDRMQQELDDFVSKVRELVRQERLVGKDLGEFVDAFRKAVEGDSK